ncbi:MFS transporter [Paenibacillus cellulositrophicus]|uniref:MFS transporter n=1 Tax=Paenibacillus cellulositrophicus TaxID=562959 RepID=UPI00203D73E3|nr:MFS transporter [Paenibacillus cellulositrophicus]
MQHRNEVQVSRFNLWLSILTFFSVMNETMFNVSLPEIATYFHIAPSAANWTNTCFSISFAIGVAVYGKISEHAGIRTLLLFGMLTYGFGSLLGLLGYGWYPCVLAARVFQGIGASAIPSLIMVMIVKVVQPENQGKAFGLIGSVVAFGEGLGPVIGGTVSGYMHWSLLFALPLLSLLALPFVLRTLPDEPTEGKAFDITGAILLSSGILSFALFMTLLHWIYLTTTIVLFALLACHIRRHREPFLEPFLFRKKRYLSAVLTGALLLGTVAGFISMVPYLMSSVYDMPTRLIGSAILFPGTLSVILFGVLGGMLADRSGHIAAMLTGLCMITTGFLVVLFLTDRTPWVISASMILTFGGLSFVKTAVSASVASTLEENETGSGIGMLNFTCFLAEGIGIAGVGGLLTKPWLKAPIVGTLTSQTAALYSNMMLIFIALSVFGGILFVVLYKRNWQ